MRALACLLLHLWLADAVVAAETNAAPRSFAYVLQAESLGKQRADAVTKLAACDRDWLVLDAAYTTGADGAWQPADLTTIRAGKLGRKVLAYLSIGEAEDYRRYWQKPWDADHDGRPDVGAPVFLLTHNPDWQGNYRVKYWRPEWQRLILAEADRIVAAGFDGVYLDIVDGFEFFEQDGKRFLDNRPNPETGHTYREDMIAWVRLLAAHVREGRPGALVIPQNGSQLLAKREFLEVVDGIGIEDLFCNGDKRQPKAHTREVLVDLKPLRTAGKPVLVIEYPRKAALREEARTQAKAEQCVLLATDRQLKTLGESVP